MHVVSRGSVGKRMSTEESSLSVVAAEPLQAEPEPDACATMTVRLWLLDVGLLVVIVLAIAVAAVDTLG
jgi:hypothetical protein